MSASEEIDDAIDNLKSAIAIADKYAEVVSLRTSASGASEEIIIISATAFDDMKDEIETAKSTLADAKVEELEAKIDELQKRIEELEADAE